MSSPVAGRICLVTPGHLSTNPRVVKEADCLSNAGYDVSIVAASFAPWAAAADASFAGRPWRVVDRIPFGPHQALALQYWRQTIRRHTALGLARAGVGGLYEPAGHPITPELSRAAKKVPADLYVAHYVAALPAAARAARRHHALYAFDAEDFHLGDLPDVPEHALSKHIIRSIEGRYLPGCAYMTAASPGIADAYAETYGLPRPTVVLNAFPKSQAPPAPTPCGTMSPGPSIYWFSQTIGPGRGLECAVQAIGLSRARPHLYLRGTPAPGFLATLGAVGTEAGVAERIHVLKPGPPPEMERLAAAFDLGFVGETTFTINHSICLANKLFTYLLAGLPVLASSTPAHTALAPELGTAMRTFPLDPAKLAEVMDELLLDPPRLAAARFAAWQLGQQRFNWESEQRALLQCVSAALAAHKRTPVLSLERSPQSVDASNVPASRAPRPEAAVRR